MKTHDLIFGIFSRHCRRKFREACGAIGEMNEEALTLSTHLYFDSL